MSTKLIIHKWNNYAKYVSGHPPAVSPKAFSCLRLKKSRFGFNQIISGWDKQCMANAFSPPHGPDLLLPKFDINGANCKKFVHVPHNLSLVVGLSSFPGIPSCPRILEVGHYVHVV